VLGVDISLIFSSCTILASSLHLAGGIIPGFTWGMSCGGLEIAGVGINSDAMAAYLSSIDELRGYLF